MKLLFSKLGKVQVNIEKAVKKAANEFAEQYFGWSWEFIEQPPKIKEIINFKSRRVDSQYGAEIYLPGWSACITKHLDKVQENYTRDYFTLDISTLYLFYFTKYRGNSHIEKINSIHRYDMDGLLFKPNTRNGSVVLSTHGMDKDPDFFAFLTKYEFGQLAVGNNQPDSCLDDNCLFYHHMLCNAKKETMQKFEANKNGIYICDKHLELIEQFKKL